MLVSWLSIGEGFHNYHHTFPQDYATSEYGFHVLNITKMFIDVMAWFGLGAYFNCLTCFGKKWSLLVYIFILFKAYDRKKVNVETIAARRANNVDFVKTNKN